MKSFTYDEKKAAKATEMLLDAICPGWRTNPEMAETADRVARRWREVTAGYQSMKERMTTFDTTYTGVVVRSGIPFYSSCSHHLKQYDGKAWVAYIPDGQKLGISKICRFVRHYSRVFSSQEELTESLAERFQDTVRTRGVFFILSAKHSCESTGGANVPNVPTTTSVVTGAFRDEPSLRDETQYLFGPIVL